MLCMKRVDDNKNNSDPLVSSQERRAAVVPRICLHRNSFVRASKETFKTIVYDALGGKRDSYFLGEPTHRHPVLPRRPAVRRPAAPQSAAPPRPARGISEFRIYKFCKIRNPVIPQVRRGTTRQGGARRRQAGRGGSRRTKKVEPGWAERCAHGTASRLPPPELMFLRGQKRINFNVNRICRIENADIPQAGRVGRGRAGRDAEGSVRPGDNCSCAPQASNTIVSIVPECLFGSTN